MRDKDDVLKRVVEWAEANDNVRAAIITSSRVHPERIPDFLSDYDVELGVSDLEPFKAGDDWLGAFGTIMVRWPREPRETCREDAITRLVHFREDFRIDFQIQHTSTPLDPDDYDDGYRVLLDKDGLTTHLSEPTYTKYHVRKPTREEFEEIVHDFWWDATYVPKCLWRDELPFAIHMHEVWLRQKFLHRVIAWHIGLGNDWSVNPGVQGRWFKHFLDAEIWTEYEATFARGDIEDNWRAFFAMIALMRKLAKGLAEALGYAYPEEMDRELTAYFERVRATPHPDGAVTSA